MGERVLFGRDSGEKTLGEVIKVNRAKLRVKQLEGRGTLRSYPVGTVWTVPPSLCQKTDASGAPVPEAPKPKRPEAIILEDIRRIYSRLSPENLHCDGEISRSAAARRGAALRRQLAECFKELGRRVSEDEAFRSVR